MGNKNEFMSLIYLDKKIRAILLRLAQTGDC